MAGPGDHGRKSDRQTGRGGRHAAAAQPGIGALEPGGSGDQLDPRPGSRSAAVLTEARRLLEITACSVWLVDPDTGELVCRQATDPHGNTLRGWRLAPGEGLAGWTVRSGQSVIVADAKLDEAPLRRGRSPRPA